MVCKQEVVDVLARLAARCDGEEGVRADGSNIDTAEAADVLARARTRKATHNVTLDEEATQLLQQAQAEQSRALGVDLTLSQTVRRLIFLASTVREYERDRPLRTDPAPLAPGLR